MTNRFRKLYLVAAALTLAGVLQSAAITRGEAERLDDAQIQERSTFCRHQAAKRHLHGEEKGRFVARCFRSYSFRQTLH